MTGTEYLGLRRFLLKLSEAVSTSTAVLQFEALRNSELPPPAVANPRTLERIKRLLLLSFPERADILAAAEDPSALERIRVDDDPLDGDELVGLDNPIVIYFELYGTPPLPSSSAPFADLVLDRSQCSPAWVAAKTSPACFQWVCQQHVAMNSVELCHLMDCALAANSPACVTWLLENCVNKEGGVDFSERTREYYLAVKAKRWTAAHAAFKAAYNFDDSDEDEDSDEYDSIPAAIHDNLVGGDEARVIASLQAPIVHTPTQLGEYFNSALEHRRLAVISHMLAEYDYADLIGSTTLLSLTHADNSEPEGGLEILKMLAGCEGVNLHAQDPVSGQMLLLRLLHTPFDNKREELIFLTQHCLKTLSEAQLLQLTAGAKAFQDKAVLSVLANIKAALGPEDLEPDAFIVGVFIPVYVVDKIFSTLMGWQPSSLEAVEACVSSISGKAPLAILASRELAIKTINLNATNPSTSALFRLFFDLVGTSGEVTHQSFQPDGTADEPFNLVLPELCDRLFPCLGNSSLEAKEPGEVKPHILEMLLLLYTPAGLTQAYGSAHCQWPQWVLTGDDECEGMPLLRAFAMRRPEMVVPLLRCTVSPISDEDYQKFLMESLQWEQSGEIAESLYEYRKVEKEFVKDFLLQAIACQQPHWVRVFSNEYTVPKTSAVGPTAFLLLCNAIDLRTVETLMVLIESDDDFGLKDIDNEGNTLLHHTAGTGGDSEHVLKFTASLIIYQVPVQTINADGESAAHIASEQKNWPLVLLLQLAEDIETRYSEITTTGWVRESLYNELAEKVSSLHSSKPLTEVSLEGHRKVLLEWAAVELKVASPYFFKSPIIQHQAASPTGITSPSH